MCSTPSTPSYTPTQTKQIATPTYADAKVQKAGENTRNQRAALTNRNVKSTALGVLDEANTDKKTLLGQ